MPLPTATTINVEQAFTRVIATANTVKSNLSGVASIISMGNSVSVDNLIHLYTVLNDSQSIGAGIQGVDGLADYAKTALNDPNYDIDAEFATSIVACTAVTTWLLANIPNDGKDGFVAWRKQDDGKIQRITIPAIELSELAGLISLALATFA